MLRMSQSRTPVFSQTQEARILYVPGCVHHHDTKLRVPYVVHRLIWNQEKDRARCLSRRVIYPDMRNGYFRLDDFADVVAAAKAVEGALNSMESTMHVDLWFELAREADEDDDDEAEDDQATTYAPTKEPVYHRWIDLPTWPVRMDLLFSTSQMRNKYHRGAAEFNSAWETLWDALGAAFVEGNRLNRVKVGYDAPIKSFARALAAIPQHA